MLQKPSSQAGAGMRCCPSLDDDGSLMSRVGVRLNLTYVPVQVQLFDETSQHLCNVKLKKWEIDRSTETETVSSHFMQASGSGGERPDE